MHTFTTRRDFKVFEHHTVSRTYGGKRTISNIEIERLLHTIIQTVHTCPELDKCIFILDWNRIHVGGDHNTHPLIDRVSYIGAGLQGCVHIDDTNRISFSIVTVDGQPLSFLHTPLYFGGVAITESEVFRGSVHMLLFGCGTEEYRGTSHNSCLTHIRH